jgi:hypothetical protein
MQILVPDLGATTDVDPCLSRLVADLEMYRAHPPIDGDESAKEAAVAFQAALLAEYEASPEAKPVVTVGFLPASKLTAIDNAKFAAVQRSQADKTQDSTEAALNAVSDSLRETVRWGVKGCSIAGVEFNNRTVDWRGKAYKVCADEVVELFERNGWLHVLTHEILRFNRLGDAKKKN